MAIREYRRPTTVKPKHRAIKGKICPACGRRQRVGKDCQFEGRPDVTRREWWRK